LEWLRNLGAVVFPADWGDASQLRAACSGTACVVSALQGLRDVIVEAQGKLLEAAVRAGVPRFIPSDFSLDFTKLTPGENRNFDLRREFHGRLERVEVSATTIFNGAFAELLLGAMPLVLFKYKLVLYWGDPDQRLDFTTIDDTAAFTACAALDPQAPRFLRIAGDQLSARELAALAVSVFWLFMIVGRIAVSPAAARFRPVALNFGLAVGSCAAGLALALSKSPAAGLAAAAASGLFMSGIFGLTVTHATHYFAERMGAALGLMLTGVGLGPLLVPAVMGGIADLAGLRLAMLVPVGLMVGVAALCLHLGALRQTGKGVGDTSGNRV